MTGHLKHRCTDVQVCCSARIGAASNRTCYSASAGRFAAARLMRLVGMVVAPSPLLVLADEPPQTRSRVEVGCASEHILSAGDRNAPTQARRGLRGSREPPDGGHSQHLWPAGATAGGAHPPA